MSNLGRMAWYKGQWYEIINIRLKGEMFEYYLYNKGWVAKNMIAIIRKKFED